MLAVLVIRMSDGYTEGNDWIEHDGVFVVRGLAFSGWMQTLPTDRLSHDRVQKIWHALGLHVRIRDQ